MAMNGGWSQSPRPRPVPYGSAPSLQSRVVLPSRSDSELLLLRGGALALGQLRRERRVGARVRAQVAHRRLRAQGSG